ncbi:MAG: sulfatase-like hydrolase/transferase [Planctomycetota bacterium]
MDRRGFLSSVGLGIMAAALGAEGNRRRPNVVLIMADDLGYECLGCNGGTSYQTPHLDRLAAAGTRFTHAYCTPLCSPTRIEIMTGRYGFRNYKGWGVLDPDERTFGHVLRDAGYATCVSGKWQLCHFHKPENADHPDRAGFDEHCVWTWRYKGKKPSRYWDPWIWQNGKLLEGTEGQYGPDIHRDFILDFITRHHDRPFFAYYPMNLVHAPFVPTPDSGDGQAGKRKKGKQYYADMVAYMDKCVGQVVAALERLGLRERTLVLFTADNGTPRGITSKMGDVTIPGGKGKMTDAGCHVALIASWPGTTPAGRVCDDLIDFSDVLPTLADLAGARLPEGVTLDGRSFLPQLRGEKGSPRDWVYIQLNKKRAVRDRRWKLYADGRLFDVAADPFEKRPFKPGDGGAEAAAARERLQKALDGLT